MSPHLDHLTTDDLQAHGTALRALGRSLLANAADDLLQDGWVAALQSPPPRHLRAWLAGTMRRLAAARRRSDWRRQRHERRVDPPEVVPSAAETAAAAEVVHRIAAAVAQLHEPYRSAVVLRFWHGLEPRQIGERLGVPPNTARSRVQRGLELLRARLSADCGGPAAWAMPLSSLLGSSSAAAVVSPVSLIAVLMAMKTKSMLAAAGLVLLLTAWAVTAMDRAADRKPNGSATQVATTEVAPTSVAPTSVAPPAAQPAPHSLATASLDRSEPPQPGYTLVRVSVADEDGNPMAGLPVVAYPGNQPAGDASTDLQGRANLQLPSGEHFLAIDAGVKPVRPDLHCSGAVVQAKGEALDVGLVMERFCCLVQARVVDDLGLPVEGVLVRRLQNTGGRTPMQLVTGADGVAAFAGLPPGTSQLDLDDRQPPPDCRVAIPRIQQPYSVARDGAAIVEFRLDRLSEVQLQLTGVESAEATLTLSLSSDRYAWNGCLQQPTAGGALTRTMPPGDYALFVDLQPDVPALACGPVHFTVGAGEHRRVEIPLEAANGELAIQLVDERGGPVAGAAVMVLAISRPATMWRKRAGPTDAQGRIVLRGMPNAPLRLFFDGHGVPDRHLAYLDGDDDRPWLELSGPQHVTAVLREAYAIAGRVIAADGTPVVDGEVCRGAAAGQPSDRTRIGSDPRGMPTEPGAFEFRYLRPGKYPLWLGSRENGPPDLEVEVGPTATPSHRAEVVLHQRDEPNAR